MATQTPFVDFTKIMGNGTTPADFIKAVNDVSVPTMEAWATAQRRGVEALSHALADSRALVEMTGKWQQEAINVFTNRFAANLDQLAATVATAAAAPKTSATTNK